MLSGLINSSIVSVVIEPTTTTSTITLSAIYRLGLLPVFNRFGQYTCDTSLSVPTHDGFYTSGMFLRCCHLPRESDIILGSDWVTASGAVFCDDGFSLLDPSRRCQKVNHWTPNGGKIIYDIVSTVQ